jgi:hypothetical protein
LSETVRSLNNQFYERSDPVILHSSN